MTLIRTVVAFNGSCTVTTVPKHMMIISDSIYATRTLSVFPDSGCDSVVLVSNFSEQKP